MEPVIAGVELGGTKSIALLARGRSILRRERRPTAPPGETLTALAGLLADWTADEPAAALGIAAFGPLDLATGRVVATTKPGWSGADVAGPFAALGCPIGIDTDVGAAALAEARWGDGVGCDPLVYLTLGTGVGGGVLAGGRPVGAADHPELGHLKLRRATGDRFPGVCRYHGDCVEGLVSGPALLARFGGPPPPFDPVDPRWAAAVHDLGALFAALHLTLAPARILVGGGVGVGQPGLIRAAAADAGRQLGGYGRGGADLAARVRPAGLGVEAGPLGAIAVGLEVLDGRRVVIGT